MLKNYIMNFTVNEDLKKLIPPLSLEEMEQLEDNIIKDGIRDPVTIGVYLDEDEVINVLIDGHNRYKIANELGLEYDTNTKDFDNIEEVKEWMILNQFGRRNLSNYQRGVLALELESVFSAMAKEKQKGGQGGVLLPKTFEEAKQKTENKVKNETGYKLGKIANVSHATIAKVKKIQKLATPEVKELLNKGEVSINAVYKDIRKVEKREARADELVRIKENAAINTMPNRIKLLEGDIFEVIHQIEDSSVDLLNTDPPYMILKDDWDIFKNKLAFLEFTTKWLKAVMPKVKSTGRVYISFSQWYQYDLYNILKENNFFGFTYKQNIIWYYKNNNQPSNRKEYRYMYEPIFYLYGKDAPVLNFTEDTYGETQQNVWEIAMPQSNFNEGKFHSAQKPLELYKRIIKTGSYDGDTVLDCFAGSGTTGIVCSELDRNCIMIERDKENIKIIKGRL